MTHTQRKQLGFHVLEVTIVIVVLAVVGLIGWKVLGKKSDNSSSTSQNGQQAYVEWSFDGTTWKPIGSAPACEEPLVIGAPIDVNLATSVLYPGQNRGGDFKPHGGIGIDDASSNKVDVYTLMDGYLYQGSRYIEGGVVQYMFDFINPCGIRFRYDHLATLSDTFMQYADQFPAPKLDDSRTTPLSNPVFVKEGTLVATAIGSADPLNVFFDVGVYDLRQPNAASKTSIYKTDSKRIEDKEQSFFSVCWFDLLVEPAKTTVKNLPARGGDKENNSDYCEV